MYEEWPKQTYVSEFLSMKCAGDVLNVVSPLGNKSSKEITESIGIVKRLRRIALKYPMKYTLYDFCAGNALTSVLSVHLLPIKNAIAVDKRPRNRKWHLAKRFEYRFEDIYNFDPSVIEENSILSAVHSCTSLAERIIEIYNNSKAEYLVLMPCCIGKMKLKLPNVIREKLGKKILWTWYLSQKCKGDTSFVIDEKVTSPKNTIIVSKKEA